MRAQGEGGDDPRIGTTVAGRYFVHRLLGRGGMGDVYEATRLADDRAVALKVLRASADEDRVRRFEREAETASRLRHPGAVEVLGSGRDADGALFLVMERVPGRDLARALADEGPLPPARAARIADAVLAVLADAHAAGVIHRDLKPANVMIAPAPGGGDAVKVLDFGIATFVEGDDDARLTRDGVAHGTPAYMSPEQIRGEPLDARSDVYAVGALLFELLAGAPPFEAPSPMAVAARQLTEAAPDLAARRRDVPAALAALVARALERDRALRPVSASAMRDELRDATAGVTDPGPGAAGALPRTEALPVAGVAREAAARRRVRVPAVIAGVAVIAIVGTLAVRGATPTPTSTSTSTSTSTATSTATSTPTPTPTSTSTSTASPRPSPKRTVASSAPAPAAVTAPAAPPFRLVRGELNAIPTPPADTGDGVLVLQATPWAEVSVAGTPLGETPREVRLGAGSYVVRAVHPELGAREERVTVRAGERALWTAVFKE